jgi:ureidoacrylate peracid hydrolase
MAQATQTDSNSRQGEAARPDGQAGYRPKGEQPGAFPPDRTALLVIDPVNDFLSEGGAAWELTESTVKMNNVIENLQRAIEGARQRSIPVLFGPMAYTEEDYTEHALQHRCGINRIMFERKMFLAGSWGADFHPELQPQEGDIVLRPHKSTDVFETDLPEHLERMGTTHLVIAGMTANLCCESTGRHATEKGYDVTFLSDAIGAENVPAYEASIRLNYPLIGNSVITVDEFLAAVDSPRGAPLPIQPGDTLRGSDNGEIGAVERVMEATEDAEACLLVSRGMILPTDTYIPLDAVVHRAQGIIFINVPKLVIGKMGWEEPPRRAARRQMLGPPASEVDMLYGSRSPTAW